MEWILVDLGWLFVRFVVILPVYLVAVAAWSVCKFMAKVMVRAYHVALLGALAVIRLAHREVVAVRARRAESTLVDSTPGPERVRSGV